ncbi:MAG TPA: hypothetical protein VMX12_03115 [Acidimicrobiia bacterium]|nr:hypothetical protein [Acidimicrobiia bacterium]
MVSRRFPTDVPTRDSRGRKGIVRARVAANTYIVDFGTPDGAAELAFYGGFDLLAVATVVYCEWMQEAATWRISSVVQLPTP